jgi:chromodomain-helicase-DNA-binding protein 4
MVTDPSIQGKTVQISAFLGTVVEKFSAWPALVVVPNSTITNWVRELTRWAPGLRVVPYYGEKKSREVIREYELSHNRVEKSTTGAKFHVLVTTYDTLVSPKDLTTVFKQTPRWEVCLILWCQLVFRFTTFKVLVVDEGQRLKNDNSLLFKKLNELNTVHRIIMTGVCGICC